jgi:hypothetical protein
MRSDPRSARGEGRACGCELPYRLTFWLPPQIAARALAGAHRPCCNGCALTVSTIGFVTIEGPSRERVFDQARRLLRVCAKREPAFSIPATLETPLRDRFGRPYPGRDSWSIIVNARVAFSPTRLSADVNETTRFG